MWVVGASGSVSAYVRGRLITRDGSGGDCVEAACSLWATVVAYHVAYHLALPVLTIPKTLTITRNLNPDL